MGITIFNIFIRGGISLVLWLEIFVFYHMISRLIE